MFKDVMLKYKNMPIQLKASFWFLMAGFFEKGITVLTIPIFTRLLNTTEYGQFNVFYSWLSIVSVIVSLNLFSGVFVQGLVKYEDRKREFISSLLGLCTTLCIMWTIIYLLFRNFWNQIFKLTTVQMFAMLLMIWTSAVFNFWSATQRVDTKYKLLIAVSMIGIIAKPSVGIFLVLHAEDKVTARILGLALVQFMVYTWLFIAQMVRGKKYFSAEFWKHALVFNIPLIPHYLSMIVLNSSDRIMIRNLVGAEEAGIYSLAYSVTQLSGMFGTAIMQTIEPWLYKKIKERQIKKIAKVAYPAFFFVSGLNILLMLFAPEAISIFAPEQYQTGIWVVPAVVLGNCFSFFYTFFAVFEFYFEKTKYIMIATVSGAAMNVILNYIFIPVFGYTAAGYTTLCCYIIFVLFHYICMMKICKEYLDGEKPYSWKFLVSFSAAIFLISTAVLLTYKFTLVRYCLIAFGFMIIIWKRKDLFKTVNQFISLRQNK